MTKQYELQDYKDYLQQVNIQDKNDYVANFLYKRQFDNKYRQDTATNIIKLYQYSANKFIKKVLEDIENRTATFTKFTYGDLTSDDYNYINSHFTDLNDIQKDFVHLCRNAKYKVQLAFSMIADKRNVGMRTVYREIDKIKPENITFDVFAIRIRRGWL